MKKWHKGEGFFDGKAAYMDAAVIQLCTNCKRPRCLEYQGCDEYREIVRGLKSKSNRSLGQKRRRERGKAD